ncbi:MAG: sigma-54 dependent transcriptional regulator [Pseudomonadota bacterium]
MSAVNAVILVDDEPHIRLAGKQALELEGREVQVFERAKPALEHVSLDWPGVVVSDIKMPEMDGLTFMRSALAVDHELPFVLITGHGDVGTAVEAMRDGAYDFIEKPFASDRLVEVVGRALEKRRLTLENRALRRELKAQDTLGPRLIGRTEVMRRAQNRLLTVAETDVDLLLSGETGAGKEIAARFVHQHSARRDGPFVAVNAGAIPDHLVESELFGHEAGSFTDAKTRRVGKIEQSDGGTLFLDEIESTPLPVQIALLRVLQERVIERVGSNRQIPLDFRVIAATKVDLRTEADEGRFREDLYYRLHVATVDLPPLRDRRDDIPLLFQHFLLAAAARYEREPPMVSAAELRALMQHDWPGNVRELRNLAERFVLFGGDETLGLEAADLETVRARASLPEQVAAFEKTVIAQALRESQGRTADAIEKLGLPRRTFYDKLKKYGLKHDDFD